MSLEQKIELRIVREQSSYNTFIAVLSGADPAYVADEAWGRFRLQCEANMIQNRIGFYTFVCTQLGTVLVFTLPIGVRKEARSAATIVRDMLANTVWGTAVCKYHFSPEEVQRIAKTTTHMTKLHIPLLGWEDLLLTSNDYVERAKAFCNLPKCKAQLALQGDALDTPLDAYLPMLTHIEDDVVVELRQSGLMVSVVEQRFSTEAVGASSEQPSCLHEEVNAVDSPQYCTQCFAEQGLGEAHCDQCGALNIPACEVCGSAAERGNIGRRRCVACRLLLCTRCAARARAAASNRELTLQLMAATLPDSAGVMATERPGRGAAMAGPSDSTWHSNFIDRAHADRGDYPLRGPLAVEERAHADGDDYPLRGPLAVQERAHADGYDQLLGETLAVDDASLPRTCVLRFHDINFAPPEAAEMKQYGVDQKEAVVKHTLAQRAVRLWWPGASGDDVQRMLPSFVELYIELFGACYTCMANLIRKFAEPMFERLVSELSGTQFKLPKMTAQLPEVWERLERHLTGNPKVTKCRACLKKFDTQQGEVVCSETCAASNRATHNGLVCRVCGSVVANPTLFTVSKSPAATWYPLAVLEKTDDEILSLLPREHAGPIIEENPVLPCTNHHGRVDTKREKNPVLFCSEACESAWQLSEKSEAWQRFLAHNPGYAREWAEREEKLGALWPSRQAFVQFLDEARQGRGGAYEQGRNPATEQRGMLFSAFYAWKAQLASNPASRTLAKKRNRAFFRVFHAWKVQRATITPRPSMKLIPPRPCTRARHGLPSGSGRDRASAAAERYGALFWSFHTWCSAEPRGHNGLETRSAIAVC